MDLLGYTWATAIAEKEGKYYFYFCGKKKDGESAIGVAVADRPEGPFIAVGYAYTHQKYGGRMWD